MLKRIDIVRIGLVAAALSFGAATAAEAQTEPRSGSRGEVFVTLGWGRVWRFQGRAYGDGPNIGAGVAIRSRAGWGLALQTDFTIGPRSLPVVVSANGQYHFRSDRGVQPYLSAGIGTVWTRLDARAGDRRTAGTNLGFGPNLGAGVRRSDPGRSFLQADINWIEGVWLSPANLSVTRMSVAMGR